MDLTDEKPRKHPTPVPFCESILKPTVPDVSLISLDNCNNQCEKKNDSFSGTEFQTYNAWRWKYMSEIDKIGRGENQMLDNSNYIIKDKYATSETEKRKNEILYGKMDEPRKPLKPKTFPEIPDCSDLFLSSNSVDNFKPSNDETKETNYKQLHLQEKIEKSDSDALAGCYIGKGEKWFDNSKNLYNIISEQNKQIDVLQQQIEQILKLQHVKDRQIEQLLLSHEAKEKKIEKLLQSVVKKDQEIENLHKIKVKQEQSMKDIIKSQEEKDIKSMELLKKISQTEKKEVCSIGTMTGIQVVDVGTNTCKESNTGDLHIKQKETSENSCLRDLNESNALKKIDRSLSLHSTDLAPLQEQVPTPQSSIHLDIQDFQYSSEDSESESGTVKSAYPPPSNPLGYTFYNNIMSQVKDIIQNSGEKESESRISNNVLSGRNCIKEKVGSLKSYQAWEVLERENISPATTHGKHHVSDRFPCRQQEVAVKEQYSPSDVSLKINSLALKYLKQEQISQYNVQPQFLPPRHHDVTIYNVTNLSFGSTRYLDRFRVLPNSKACSEQEPLMAQNCGSPGQLNRRRRKLASENALQSGNLPEANMYK